jgi:plasmid stabilization system protein ParE
VIVIWSPQATDDFEAAVAYLAPRNPIAARKLASGVIELVERLANEPLDGAEVTLTTGETVRSWPYPPFRLNYRRVHDAFQVVRLYHQKRHPIAEP